MEFADRRTELKSKKKTSLKELHCPLTWLFRLALVGLSWSPASTSGSVDTRI